MRLKNALSILIVCIVITIGLVATSFAQPTGTRYLGCYKDTYDRDISREMQQDNQLTLQSCANICRQKGFKYAAAQYGSWCFCGNSYGKHGQATNCDMKCAGNSNEICGGAWANSIYELVLSPWSGAADADTSHVTGIGEYKGCFQDNEADRDLNKASDFIASLTLEMCADLCRKQGHKYAGAQYRQHCFCGDSYGKYGKATNCNMNCAGNSNEICGGPLANSVYDVLAGGTASTSTTVGPAVQIGLTGFWKDNNGAIYSIRQIDDQIWWYMDGKPNWTNVFKGNKSGSTISGEWCDVPGGKLEGKNTGSLILKIINDNRLEKVSAYPSYGGSVWTRLNRAIP